ncbi:MAG TPA: hypothetical protein DCL21_07495 [Alphaproteobacteria bacterium]|nr:hypothetical protein [Alphaproteobacteria bacterium]
MFGQLNFNETNFKATVIALSGRPYGVETEKTISDIITSISLKKVITQGELVCKENTVETYFFNGRLVSIMDHREVISAEIALMFISEAKKKEIFEKVLNLAPAQA